MKTICLLALLTTLPAAAKPTSFELSARCAQWSFLFADRTASLKHLKISRYDLGPNAINYEAGYAEGVAAAGGFFTNVTKSEYAKKMYREVKCKQLLPI